MPRPILSRSRCAHAVGARGGGHLAALVVLVAALAGPAPAAAFDSEPHGDLTVEAMRAEGFGPTAAKVAWVANYFVDFYSQASSDPYSGHAAKKVALAAQPIGAFEYENWSPTVMHAASTSHFDGTDRPGGFPNTDAVTAEWSRLRRATYNLVRAAKAKGSAVDLLEVIGMSLHEVQDFYAHGNWVERVGDRGSIPGWDPGVEGSVPTWFDVPANRRGTVYTSSSTGHRGHGSWQQDGNLNLLNGLSKDWPGRPRYVEAYMTSAFATRQWVQAIRDWVADPVLWDRARAYAGAQSELEEDINDNVIAVSRNTGRWSGEGGPCQPDVSFDSGPTCGAGEGKGGTLLGARSAIKDYHGDHDPTSYRKSFERLVPGLALDPADVTEAMVPVASSRPLQAATQFVRLRLTQVRGIQLEDPLPTDGADLYAKTRIAGQDYLSAVIDDADSFSFPAPYAPFTFLRAVPRDGRYPTPVTQITVKIHTGDVRSAGTNDDVYLN
ncbi:MAG: hypothetical protein JWM31_3434, partial [Solirubrobacterales bacterium]|nr:hypothetical protein [Solirubrobacterales bacterium]